MLIATTTLHSIVVQFYPFSEDMPALMISSTSSMFSAIVALHTHEQYVTTVLRHMTYSPVV